MTTTPERLSGFVITMSSRFYIERNSASPSRNVFSAQGLVTSSLCGSRTYSTSSAMFVTGIMHFSRSKSAWSPEQNICRSSHARQKIRSTLFRHRLRKITQDIFNPSFVILASISQVYLSLYLDQYRWKVGFQSSSETQGQIVWTRQRSKRAEKYIWNEEK